MSVIMKMPVIVKGDKKAFRGFLREYIGKLKDRDGKVSIEITELLCAACDSHCIYEKDVEYILTSGITYNDAERLVKQRRYNAD